MQFDCTFISILRALAPLLIENCNSPHPTYEQVFKVKQTKLVNPISFFASYDMLSIFNITSITAL